MIRLALSLSVTAACGFTGPLNDNPDGAVDTSIDAPTDARMKRWGTPTQVMPASVDQDDDPTATGDLTELYFNRLGDIYVLKRATAADPWSLPVIVAELSEAGTDDTTPKVSTDGLTMFIASIRNGGMGGFDLWVSTRLDRSASWTTPVVVPELNSTLEDFGAASFGAGPLSLALFSSRTGVSYDMFMATRDTTTMAWSAPVPLAGVNSAMNELSPLLSPDGLTIYFDSDRGGNFDLYASTRASSSEPFALPIAIFELDTPASETDAWVSPDQNHILFSSTRSGISAIWEASR